MSKTPIFAYLYNKAEQILARRDPVVFTTVIGNAFPDTNIVGVSGTYKVTYTLFLTNAGAGDVTFGLFSDESLLCGTKYSYGTVALAGTIVELVATTIVDLTSNERLTLRNLGDTV